MTKRKKASTVIGTFTNTFLLLLVGKITHATSERRELLQSSTLAATPYPTKNCAMLEQQSPTKGILCETPGSNDRWHVMSGLD
jgi:hypothetical protein